ncbi:hypothetical protein HPB49_026359 [Dermacentor silvarum]|nr:hypothetical protein HPB49_026359 [Dermacentor silvarum]
MLNAELLTLRAFCSNMASPQQPLQEADEEHKAVLKRLVTEFVTGVGLYAARPSWHLVGGLPSSCVSRLFCFDNIVSGLPCRVRVLCKWKKTPTTIKEVAKMLADFGSKFDAFSSKVCAEMQEVRNSLSFMNAHFEEFKVALEKVKQEQVLLKKENKQLHDQLKKTQKELTQLKQYSRQQNLEIKGLPKKPNENLADAMVEAGKELGIPLTYADIDSTRQIKTALNLQTSEETIRRRMR